MSARVLICALAAVSVTACAPHAATSSSRPPATSVATPSPSPIATASPSPTPASPAAPAVRPAAMPIAFSGLRNGTYPVHLHSVCSGMQQFHITVLPSLVVTAGGGAIEVPAGYFGRGLCVIVYSSPSLTSVLTTRRI